MRLQDDILIERFWYDSTSEPIRATDEDVKELQYHQALGEGDRHYVDVVLKNGYVQRHFVINAIEFKGTCPIVKASTDKQEEQLLEED